MAEHALKPGWTWVRLGDVAKQVKDRVKEPSACGVTHYVPGGGIHADSFLITEWLPIDDGLMGPAFHMRFLPGQTLYKSRVPHGVAVADRIGICANTTYVLQAKEHRLLPDLLPYILTTQAFHLFEDQTNRGSTNLFLNFSDISQYEFALPPLAEQRYIVALLRCIDELLESCKDLLQASLTVAQSTFGQLVDREPSSRICTLEDLCEFVTDGDHNPPRRKPTGIPHLVVNNVSEGQIIEDGCTFISPRDYERVSKRYSPKGGDIIITCVGTIGRTALVPEDYIFSADRSLAICRPDKRRLLPDYARWLFSSQHVQYEFLRMSIGTAQLHLYLGELRKVKLKLPDVSAQRLHLAQLARFSVSQQVITARIERLRNVRATAISTGLESRSSQSAIRPSS